MFPFTQDFLVGLQYARAREAEEYVFLVAHGYRLRNLLPTLRNVRDLDTRDFAYAGLPLLGCVADFVEQFQHVMVVVGFDCADDRCIAVGGLNPEKGCECNG